MAYRAYLNNTELFFDSSLQEGSFLLTYAVLDLQYGSAGEFTFRIPPQNSHYDDFQRLTSYVDVYRDDDLIFSGRVYSVMEQFDLQREISCEGLLAVLNDSIFRPILFDGTLRELVTEIVTSHNSQVESDKQISVGVLTIPNAECYRDYQNYETSISRLKDLVQSFGGYLNLVKTNNGLVLNWYEDMIGATSQKIELASNMIDIQHTVDSSGIITVLIPLGAPDEEGKRLTIKTVNEGLDYITASAEAIEQYGYIVGTQIWDDVTEPAILKSKGLTWLASSLVPRATINLTAVDLADAGYNVDSFLPGQKITVLSKPHHLENVQFLCQSQFLNLLQPASNKLQLGEVRIGFVQSLNRDATDKIVEIISQSFATKSQLQDAVDTATSLISGNSGGYVVMHDSDDDGLPDEILVMDTPDIDTAVKVWRWNNSGLGYSNTGYEGPYGLAMTMNGQIVADYIATGTLNANLLKAGIIRGQQGNSYWDLNTGVLHIEGSGDTDKSKVFIYTPTPPYYVGDLWVTQRDDSSGVVGYMIAGYGVVGNPASGEGGKIMTCTYTRTSGDFSADDWSLITNYVSDTDLQILEQRVSSAELNISANTATIQTKASQETIDYLGNRIEVAESTITQQAEEIELKVSESDVTGNYVVGKINLSSTTATIAAEHVDLQGAVTISSFDATTQSKVVIGSTSKNQYYLSTSASSLSGGSWGNSVTWESGKYIWTRIATTKTYADNSTSTSYSDAIYDGNLTTALSTSSAASATANSALSATVSVYYRTLTATAPAKPTTSTSIGTSDNTDDVWEYVLPKPKRAAYFFTCERYTDKSGTVSFSTVRQMSNLTATSLWCSANNATLIDGEHIATNSITANQIDTNAITAEKIKAGAVTIAKMSADAQSELVAAVSSQNQYYLSTSTSSATGGSWANSVTWASGKYIWTRIKTTRTYVDGTSSESYSTAIYDKNLTTALSTSASATTTANGSLASTVSVYYRTKSTSTPSINTSTSIGTSDDTDNAWEYVLLKPKYGYYFWTCERYTKKDGSVSFSSVRQMSNLTVTSLWCSSNDATVIDGKHIATYSISADQIETDAITAEKIKANAVTAEKISISDLQAIGATIGGFQIDSNSIHTKNVAITSNADNSVGLSSSTFARTINDVSRSNLKFAIGANLGISKDGTLYAGGAVLAGTITAGNGGKIGDFNITNGALIYGSIAEKHSGVTLTSQKFAIAYYQDSYRTYKYTVSQNEIFWDYSKDNSSSYARVAKILTGYTNASVPYFYFKMGSSDSDVMSLYYKLSGHTSGYVSVSGDLTVTGKLQVNGTKSRVADTADYGKRELYAYETPVPFFGDIGEGTIGEDGFCYIPIDPILAETVILNQYQVFLQKYGAGDCWIQERKSGFFIVQGTPGLSFGWELKAKQADFDQLRMEKQDIYYTPPATDMGAEAASYIENLREGRINAA